MQGVRDVVAILKYVSSCSCLVNKRSISIKPTGYITPWWQRHIELSECMMELIIASSFYDSFRKDLLGKPIGYTTAETLQEGRQYEATTAGNAQLEKMAQVSEDVSRNCGTNHKPRQCPAYRDACTACGSI